MHTTSSFSVLRKDLFLRIVRIEQSCRVPGSTGEAHPHLYSSVRPFCPAEEPYIYGWGLRALLCDRSGTSLARCPCGYPL